MCPDCSPPTLSPNFFIFSRTYLSPTFALISPIPFSSRYFSNPILLNTVVTTLLSFNNPFFFNDCAIIAIIKSPSTICPVWSTAISLSASPSNASPRSALYTFTTSCKSSG